LLTATASFCFAKISHKKILPEYPAGLFVLTGKISVDKEKLLLYSVSTSSNKKTGESL